MYEDAHGVNDDFKEALLEFGRNTDAEQRRNFRILKLALEHQGEILEDLIEIKIVKEHPIGQSPICIKVNGVYRVQRLHNPIVAAHKTLAFDVLNAGSFS